MTSGLSEARNDALNRIADALTSIAMSIEELVVQLAPEDEPRDDAS